MPEWILELASELPMLALALGFMFFWNRHLSAAEVRHSAERKDSHASFMVAIKTISGECHASQDRASASLSEIAKESKDTGSHMSGIDAKLDVLVSIAQAAVRG